MAQNPRLARAQLKKDRSAQTLGRGRPSHVKMPEVIEVATQIDVPEGALCLGCNYPLRGLPEARCPECGRTFDPSNSWTMNTGRPMPAWARKLIEPVGWPTQIVFYISAAAVVWGAAWLPGGSAALIYGAYALLLNIVYRNGRLSIACLVAIRYRQPRPVEPQIFGTRSAGVVIVIAVAVLLYFDVPLRLMLACARPAIYKIWAVDPAPTNGGLLGPRWIGPLRVKRIYVDPNSVLLSVPGCGYIFIDMLSGRVRAERTSPFEYVY